MKESGNRQLHTTELLFSSRLSHLDRWFAGDQVGRPPPGVRRLEGYLLDALANSWEGHKASLPDAEQSLLGAMPDSNSWWT